MRKEPDEVEELEETEDEVNDDFENIYKGQVSKSGIAVLPSKRTRRAPDQKSKTSNLAQEALSELKSEQPVGAWIFVIILNIVGFAGYFYLKINHIQLGS